MSIYLQNNLASALLVAGRVELAIERLRVVRTALTSLRGADHPAVLYVEVNMASAMLFAQPAQLDEARQLLESVRERGRKAWGAKHEAFASIEHNLGDVARQQGRLAEAASHFRAAIAMNDAVGMGLHNILHTMRLLAETEIQRGCIDEARPVLERATTFAVTFDADARAAELWAMLAASWEACHVRSEAVALMARARDAYAVSGDEGASGHAACVAWLARHPVLQA